VLRLPISLNDMKHVLIKAFIIWLSFWFYECSVTALPVIILCQHML